MKRFRYHLLASFTIVLIALYRLVDYFDALPVGLKQIADGKAHKGKVFCWIMTSRRNHENRARIVDETWPRRCDKYEFFTDDGNTTFPSAGIFHNLTEGHLHLWPKTKTALRHIYHKYLNEFDWFLKADDDTYIVVENLKLMLGRFDARVPHYLGFRMKPYIDDGFNSGGAGYVLSRAALAAFVEKASNNQTICKGGWAEDLELAYCLKNIGILPGDTRDATGHNTFFPYHPNLIIKGKIPNDGDYNFWYYYQMKKVNFELSCQA
jgi:glycoprotein-N-acetylgalactosamine 3-beta-galactosyltransferase